MNEDFDIMFDDVVRLTNNDNDLNTAFNAAAHIARQKGYEYRELFGSKLFGRIKYILLESGPKEQRMFSLTDLDTGEEATR